MYIFYVFEAKLGRVASKLYSCLELNKVTKIFYELVRSPMEQDRWPYKVCQCRLIQ